MSKKSSDPSEWTQEKLDEIAAYYENQTDEEAAAEDEAYFNDPRYQFVRIPRELVAEVEEIVRLHEASRAS